MYFLQVCLYILSSTYKHRRRWAIFTSYQECWCSSNALYLYSGGAWFKIQAGHWLLQQIIHGYPQSLQANAGTVQVCHNNFLPNPFQFIVHQLSYHSALYTLRYWQHYKTDHKNIYSHPSQSDNLKTSHNVNTKREHVHLHVHTTITILLPNNIHHEVTRIIWDLGFSQWWILRLWSSRMWHLVSIPDYMSYPNAVLVCHYFFRIKWSQVSTMLASYPTSFLPAYSFFLLPITRKLKNDRNCTATGISVIPLLCFTAQQWW